MLPGADTHDQTTDDTARRERLLQRAVELRPDADLDTQLRLAEWLAGGAVLLDPARVTVAAQALAAFDTTRYGVSVEWDSRSRDAQAGYEGRAAQVVTAYLDGAL